MPKAFLGGTCNDTDWREKLKPLLKIEYFDPIVKDREWDEADRQNEIHQRQVCEFVVYGFTPRMTGLYSIAEAIDDSNKRPASTVIYVQEADVSNEGKRVIFTESVRKSMDAIAELAKWNGAKICYDLQTVADFVNG